MDEAFNAIERWRITGQPGIVARVITMTGFGGRRTGEVLAISGHGEKAGSLLGGAVTAAVEAQRPSLLAHRDPAGSVIDVELGDPEATSAGLACGGAARLLVQRIDAVPSAAWVAIAERTPVAIATWLNQPQSSILLASDPARRAEADPATLVGSTPATEATTFAREATVVDDGEIRQAGAALLRRGRTGSQLIETERGTAAVEAFVPVLRLIIAGGADLSRAIERQAGFLGWQASTTDGLPAAEIVSGLGAADAVVVLSHDAAVYGPVLNAALNARCGYVGALGSRHTQSLRRQLLVDAGLPPELVATIHGPAGLDIGAGTPEETAVAICAEIIAVRSGRSGTALRDSSGPINL